VRDLAWAVRDGTKSLRRTKPLQSRSPTWLRLRVHYLEGIGRPTGSSNKAYLIWKIREAKKGRIPVGPRKNARREGVTFKILPLRMETEVVDKVDEAWRSRGIKNRMEFLRGALGHYLTHLGAEEAAALFAYPTAVGA